MQGSAATQRGRIRCLFAAQPGRLGIWIKLKQAAASLTPYVTSIMALFPEALEVKQSLLEKPATHSIRVALRINSVCAFEWYRHSKRQTNEAKVLVLISFDEAQMVFYLRQPTVVLRKLLPLARRSHSKYNNYLNIYILRSSFCRRCCSNVQ